MYILEEEKRYGNIVNPINFARFGKQVFTNFKKYGDPEVIELSGSINALAFLTLGFQALATNKITEFANIQQLSGNLLNPLAIGVFAGTTAINLYIAKKMLESKHKMAANWHVNAFYFALGDPTKAVLFSYINDLAWGIVVNPVDWKMLGDLAISLFDQNYNPAVAANVISKFLIGSAYFNIFNGLIHIGMADPLLKTAKTVRQKVTDKTVKIYHTLKRPLFNISRR